MAKNTRISRVKPSHNLPKVEPKVQLKQTVKTNINKQKKPIEVNKKQSTKTKPNVTTSQQMRIESAYARPAQKYWRPFESRQATRIEQEEINIEKEKLFYGFYNIKN